MKTKSFEGQNLRGESFKNQDLSGADFSGCDVRGVDFSGADLTAARFCAAKMGRTTLHELTVIAIKFLIGFLAAYSMPKYSLSVARGVMHSGFFPDFMDKLEIILFLSLYIFLLATATIIDYKNRRLKYILLFLIVSAILGFPGTAVVFTMLVARIITLGERSAILTATAGTLLGLLTIILNTHEIEQGIANAILCISFSLYLLYDSRQASTEHLKWVHYLGSCLNSWGGCTQFAFATLKEVDFSKADLRYARFNNSMMTGCNFSQARNDALAVMNETPMANPKVRKLMIHRQLDDKNFSRLDLHGLDFSGLDLHRVDFSNANLSFANFSGCDLRNANLSETNATGACFSDSHMTGVCIKNWNIDANTQLRHIECDYVYLAANGQQRNPPENTFAADEFSRLYQQVADTIDFIVHNRVELDALSNAIAVIKLEEGNEDIFVQGIERKESAIIVRVKTPSEFDHEKLYKDITQLQHELEKEKRLNEDKSRYIADAAHDLKNSVIGLEYVLREGCRAISQNDGSLASDSMHDAKEITRSMRVSFDAIMDISRLESGMIKPDYSVFDSCQLVTEVFSELKAFASERKVELHLTKNGDAIPPVTSDYHCLKRVLSNLVSNGIKYADYAKSEPAMVMIEISEDDDGFVRLDVADNGIGIPKERQEDVFAPLYQLDNPENDRNKGIGLGLAIVRSSLDLLDNHSMKLSSRLDAGTRFSLRLPKGVVPD